MLTRRLQRRVAEEEAMIEARVGTTQLLQELTVGELSSAIASGSRKFAVRIVCRGPVQPRQGVGAREINDTRVVEIRHLPGGGGR